MLNGLNLGSGGGMVGRSPRRSFGGAHGDQPCLRNGPSSGNLLGKKYWPGDIQTCRISQV